LNKKLISAALLSLTLLGGVSMPMANVHAATPTATTSASSADLQTALNHVNQLRAADGKSEPALTLNSDLNKWAQARADELAAGQTTFDHSDMKHGMPAWANQSLFTSPLYVSGTSAYGPECLHRNTVATTNIETGLNSWWAEKTATSGTKDHYLTLSSTLANSIGFGIARGADGYTYVVSETAYDVALNGGKTNANTNSVAANGSASNGASGTSAANTSNATNANASSSSKGSLPDTGEKIVKSLPYVGLGVLALVAGAYVINKKFVK